MSGLFVKLPQAAPGDVSDYAGGSERISGAFAQFFGEQGGLHPGKLCWPGDADGYPVLDTFGGVPPLLKQEEIENQLERKFVFRHKLFHLWNEEESAEYGEVMERISSKLFNLVYQDRKFVAEQQHYTVYLEWLQIYSTVPPRLQHQGR